MTSALNPTVQLWMFTCSNLWVCGHFWKRNNVWFVVWRSVVDRMNTKYADMHIKYAGGLQMLEFQGFFNPNPTWKANRNTSRSLRCC